MTGLCMICEKVVSSGDRCTDCIKRSREPRATVTQVKPQKIVLLFDPHIPEHDRKLWYALLAFLRDFRPDEIIIGGDFLELVSCSMHSWSEGQTQFEQDMKAGRIALRSLRKAAPNARITYLEGNHETRLTRFLMEKAPNMIGSLTIPLQLSFAEFGVTWVPEGKQPISRGTLDILHGHQLGSGGAGLLPKYHTAKATAVFGQVGRQVLYGHVHTTQETGATMFKGRAMAKSFGCLRSLEPGWLRGAPSGWVHEFGVALVAPNGHTELYSIKPKDGAFMFGSKIYAGRK